MPYVELHCHSAYSFLDGASHPEELALRAAELGYEALALTDHDGVYGSLELAHAAKLVGVRAITGAEITLDGGAHVTVLVESSQGYANLCRLLTAAHAQTRPKEGELLPPSLDPALLAELNEGLVCLSGCARDGLGVHDPNAAAELARAFGRGALLRRAAAAVRARRREAERAPARPRRARRRRDRRHRQRPRAPSAPHRAPGRPRRDPPQHLARVERARAARQPREHPARAGGAARALPRRPRRGPAHRRDRGPARVRPDRGARLPLSRLLRRRRPRDQAARPGLRRRVRGALPAK